MHKTKARRKSRDNHKLKNKTDSSASNQGDVTPRPHNVSGGQTKPRQRLKEIRRDVLKGILFILIMFSVKLLIEQTSFGKHLEAMGYNFLQTRLSQQQVPITIVDISDLAQKDYVVNGAIVRATPREPLREMIQALAEQRPKAIGVDIDFSPDENGYMPGDRDFFQFCLDISEQTGVPVFLGIKRSIGKPAADWLGSDRYAELAASILVPKDTRRMASLINVEEETVPAGAERRVTTISSMSKRLAEAWGGESDPPAQALLRRWGLLEKFSEKQLGYGVSPEDFLVDYGPLESIESIQATDGTVLRDGSQRDRIFGKIILIGDATVGKATDIFPVPGREYETYPGVFLHACGAYTLHKAPLYEPTHSGRIVIDLLLSGGILAALVLIGLFYRERESYEKATHQLGGILTWFTVVAAIVIGVVFVRNTRIMWDDFFLAVILLVFHPSVEQRAESLWEKARKLFAGKDHASAEDRAL